MAGCYIQYNNHCTPAPSPLSNTHQHTTQTSNPIPIPTGVVVVLVSRGLALLRCCCRGRENMFRKASCWTDSDLPLAKVDHREPVHSVRTDDVGRVGQVDPRDWAGRYVAVRNYPGATR